MDNTDQIVELERRIVKLNKDRETLNREQAVLEDRYEAALKTLKGLGIDAEEMKRSELVALQEKLNADLEAELARLEEEVTKGEEVLTAFKKAQG